MPSTILLTGSTGYIGRRLLPLLLAQRNRVVCLVRDQRRFDFDDFTAGELELITVVEGDLTNPDSMKKLPKQIDAAYYLVHSMTSSKADFKALEEQSATNFKTYINKTSARQIIYLGGIVNDGDLSEHLTSRMTVEKILAGGNSPLTVLRAAIIIGSGSASFEIIRDLVEKLPIMIAPKWLRTRCQPIAIKNVMEYLTAVLLNNQAFHKSFDIGGPDILSYKEMLLQFALVRGLRRYIITLPVLSPKLSSLWLYFITSTSYPLARNLVDSMKNEVVVRDHEITEVVSLELATYEEALGRAFSKINQRQVPSSWRDAFGNPEFSSDFLSSGLIPQHGCYTDVRILHFERDPQAVLDNIWQIGGERGWYYGKLLWEIRGLLDLMAGGVGLRRGRRSSIDLKTGDALDFWRVLIADRKKKRLVLYAEMKIPGEAWLEFRIHHIGKKHKLVQKAVFRPLGLLGRLYWYAVLPFHHWIFNGMIRNIVRYP